MYSFTAKKSLILSVLAGLMAFAVSAEAKGAPSVARLDRRSGAGKIALQTKSRASLPGDATWNYFDKNSPLVPSGLLGPVRVVEEE